MKNKGFAISGILYTILLIFLALMMMLLFNFEGKKNVLDKIKSDVLSELNANKVYANGYAVYFNPVTGKVCTEEEASTNVNEFGTPTNIKTGCMKWYTFNDTKESDTVKMILDHNAISNISWNDLGINVAYEDSNIPAAIQMELSNWDSSLGTTIITAEEINNIVGGVSTWDVSNYNTGYYFDSRTQTREANSSNKSAYAWLYDNTYGCLEYGCNIEDNNTYTIYDTTSTSEAFGYWTQTPLGTIGSGSSAWHVARSGSLRDSAGYTDIGVRPVITVSKDVLNPNIETCSIEPGTQFNFDYTGDEQEFTVPCDGYYKLETWGAQGGSYDSTYYGGYGAYSLGKIIMEKSNILYVNSGGQGDCIEGANKVAQGGYNGGGNGYTHGNLKSTLSCGGGGATHIALENGLLSTFENKKDNLLIVSGAGGGIVKPSSSNYSVVMPYNGDGGGVESNKSVCKNSNQGTFYYYGSNQTSVGTYTLNGYNEWIHLGSFGQGGSAEKIMQSSGGGGGYYGGNSGKWASPGGSGYIGNPNLTDKSMYCYNCTESTEESTKTISTTCHSSDPTENCAKEGNGYARITYLGK